MDDTNNSHINSEQDEPDVDRFILNMAHAALVWAHKKPDARIIMAQLRRTGAILPTENNNCEIDMAKQRSGQLIPQASTCQ